LDNQIIKIIEFKKSMKICSLVVFSIFVLCFTNEEVKRKMFSRGFISGITDIQVGPDGYLYFVACGQGAIYIIAHK
jgi:hypothetical protein